MLCSVVMLLEAEGDGLLVLFSPEIGAAAKNRGQVVSEEVEGNGGL